MLGRDVSDMLSTDIQGIDKSILGGPAAKRRMFACRRVRACGPGLRAARLPLILQPMIYRCRKADYSMRRTLSPAPPPPLRTQASCAASSSSSQCSSSSAWACSTWV